MSIPNKKRQDSCPSKFSFLNAFILSIFTLFSQILSPLYASQPIVAITQIVNHPALNQQRDGIIAALKEAGYTPDQNISIVTEDAQGNIGIATQIATKFSSLGAKVVVGISTPSAQSLIIPMQAVGVPVIYTAVTDPVSAKLTLTPETVTGVSCAVPIKDQLLLIQQVLPAVKSIGVVHNPGEANAAATVQKIQQEATALGIQVVVATAAKTSEVTTATLSLMGNVQALLLADDNTVASAIESVLAITQEHKIPVFTSDLDLIQKGAVGGLAVNHFALGKQAGQQVVRILGGDKVADIPAESPKEIVLTGNKIVAQALGVTMPDDVTWVTGQGS